MAKSTHEQTFARLYRLANDKTASEHERESARRNRKMAASSSIDLAKSADAATRKNGTRLSGDLHQGRGRRGGELRVLVGGRAQGRADRSSHRRCLETAARGIGGFAGPGGVTTGVPVLIGNLFGIPELTAAAGAPFALNLTGVHRLPKAAGELQAGALAYWNADPGTVVATASTNYLIAAVAELPT